MIISVVPAKPGDLDGLVERSIYAGNPIARRAFNTHVRMSADVWVGKIDGVVVCAIGLIQPSLISEQAYVWVLAEKLAEQHKFVFIRYSQRILEVLLNKYESIVGYCLAQESSSIKWLKFLGAKFDDPQGDKLPFKIRRTSR